MGNGVLAIGPKLPRPSSTLPSRTFAGQLLGLQSAGEQTLCRRGRALISLGRGLEIAAGRPFALVISGHAIANFNRYEMRTG